MGRQIGADGCEQLFNLELCVSQMRSRVSLGQRLPLPVEGPGAQVRTSAAWQVESGLYSDQCPGETWQKEREQVAMLGQATIFTTSRPWGSS
eukprot:symbB.v1.2.025406.t3/scaffold2455.1/size78842/5